MYYQAVTKDISIEGYIFYKDIQALDGTLKPWAPWKFSVIVIYRLVLLFHVNGFSVCKYIN